MRQATRKGKVEDAKEKLDRKIPVLIAKRAQEKKAWEKRDGKNKIRST